MVVSANKNYWGAEGPYLDGIVYQVFGDDDAFQINANRPPFDNSNMGQMMQVAANRQGMLDAALFGQGETSVLPPADQDAAFAVLREVMLDLSWVVNTVYNQAVNAVADNVEDLGVTIDTMLIMENVRLN